MNQEYAHKLFNLFAERWERALAENRLKDAALVAISAHLAFQELKEPTFENVALTWLSVTEKRLPSSTSKESVPPNSVTCSFCAQAKSSSEVIVGVTGQICKTCVENIGRQLRGGQ